MSHRALLLATRDVLRETLHLDRPEVCEVTFDDRPPAVAGETFFAIWPGYWRDGGSHGESLHEEYGVNVTVAVRLPKVPYDRIGVELLAKANDGLLAWCEKVRAVIHMDPNLEAIRHLANEIIGSGVEANGFLVPLQFQDGGRAQMRPGSYFGAHKEPLAGLSQTLTFGGAVRVQVIGVQQT